MWLRNLITNPPKTSPKKVELIFLIKIAMMNNYNSLEL